MLCCNGSNGYGVLNDGATDVSYSLVYYGRHRVFSVLYWCNSVCLQASKLSHFQFPEFVVAPLSRLCNLNVKNMSNSSN